MKPNVLWIFVDQLRYHALQAHGDPNSHTPNIDRLVHEGASFHNAVTTCSICTPARGAVLTGQYPHQNDIRVLGDMIEPRQKTAAHFFKDAGYHTCYIGKWHLASQQNPFGHNEGAEYWVHPKLRGGYDEWAGFELSNHFWQTRYSCDEKMWPPHKIDGYQTDGLADMSLAAMARAEQDRKEYKKPWHQVISFEAPHHGRDDEGVVLVNVGEFSHTRHPAPKEYESKYKGEDLRLCYNVPPMHEEVARSMLAQYYAMIHNLDDNIGRLLDWLDESGAAEHTIVAFFSDHGEMGGSHGCFQKIHPYDESIRIPFLIRYPAAMQPEQSIQAPANLVDLLPTCLGLAEILYDAEADQLFGHDFSRLLRSEELSESLPQCSLVQWFGNPRYFADDVEDSHYRAIRTEHETYVVMDNGDKRFYDLRDDVNQLIDRVNRPGYVERQAELHQMLVDELQRVGEALPSYLSA